MVTLRLEAGFQNCFFLHTLYVHLDQRLFSVVYVLRSSIVLLISTACVHFFLKKKLVFIIFQNITTCFAFETTCLCSRWHQKLFSVIHSFPQTSIDSRNGHEHGIIYLYFLKCVAWWIAWGLQRAAVALKARHNLLLFFSLTGALTKTPLPCLSEESDSSINYPQIFSSLYRS